MVISLSGVLLPGPLFAVTIEKATKSKVAGALIACGHGVVEVPLMFLIFFVLNEFAIPNIVQIAVGLLGGLLLMFMGIQTFQQRSKEEAQRHVGFTQDSLIAGIQTTAANPGFILWWLTVGTALILNAKEFGLIGFTVFAGIHWLCDFAWYAIVALVIFESRKFWTKRMHQGVTFFCTAVFVCFGAWFFTSALLQVISAVH
jgi:threonine/homoserine/homoserine lactone efflux protein